MKKKHVIYITLTCFDVQTSWQITNYVTIKTKSHWLKYEHGYTSDLNYVYRHICTVQNQVFYLSYSQVLIENWSCKLCVCNKLKRTCRKQHTNVLCQSRIMVSESQNLWKVVVFKKKYKMIYDICRFKWCIKIIWYMLYVKKKYKMIYDICQFKWCIKIIWYMLWYLMIYVIIYWWYIDDISAFLKMCQ